MSLASVSASGPTMTCTMLPDRSTPCAPAALRASSLTSEPLVTSVRSRVMHGSISTMLSAPPSPARICSALLMLPPALVGYVGIGGGDLRQPARAVGVEAESAGQLLDDQLCGHDRAERRQGFG